MNEVQVFFVGMCMWWLTAPGPWVLIPDLANEPLQHVAAITAPPHAFLTGTCPPGFDDILGQCTYVLNGKGGAGGVRLSFLTNTPSGAFPEQAFCAVPPVQRTTLYKLKPEYTPPAGVRNAAWMQAIGGTPRSGVFTCESRPADNCPRFVRWSVPFTPPGKVVLALDNLRGGAPILAQLAPGARVVISNSPPDEIPARRHPHAKTQDATPGPLTAEDWCFYFRMVTIFPDGVDPICPGAPPIPPPCPDMAPPPENFPFGVRFQTVACSNSQYP